MRLQEAWRDYNKKTSENERKSWGKWLKERQKKCNHQATRVGRNAMDTYTHTYCESCGHQEWLR